MGSVFGWIHDRGELEGFRRFREAFILTGKGSGKTPKAAGVGLYCLTSDGEHRAEVYSAAVDKEQAGILFRDAVAMTKLSPALDSRVARSGGVGREYNIAYHETGSFFRPISSESQGRGKSGYRPHCVLLDEIHEHPTNAMVEFMRAGTKDRRQALIFMITNAGVDRTSVCYDYYSRAIRVASGELEDEVFFAYVCAVDDGEDPFTDEDDPELGYPASWAKTNPSLEVTPGVPYVREQVQAAKGMPSKESLVRRLNFCQWWDAEAPWIGGDLWRSCEVKDLEIPSGRAFLSLDLGSAHDLTAAGRVVERNGELLAEVRIWTPEDTLIERERHDRVPYSQWVNEGHIHTAPGRKLKHDFVVRDLADWLTAPGASLAFDPWHIEYFQDALDAAGIANWIWDGPESPEQPGLRLVRHSQGFRGATTQSSLWMPKSVNDLEEVVLEGTLKVRWNPALTYASASAILKSDAAGNRMWDKRESRGRIDPIVALSMAVGLARSVPEVPVPEVHFFDEPPVGSGYEEEEPWW